MTTLITTEMLGAVGTELGRRMSHPVSESDIRRWAIAVYWPESPPARYLSPDERTVAPDDFNPFAWSVASSSLPLSGSLLDGPETALGVQGPVLANILNGGMKAVHGAPIRRGDVITSANRLAGYTERPGRLGRMLFTASEDTWTNQSGEHVKTISYTTIRY